MSDERTFNTAAERDAFENGPTDPNHPVVVAYMDKAKHRKRENDKWRKRREKIKKIMETIKDMPFDQMDKEADRLVAEMKAKERDYDSSVFTPERLSPEEKKRRAQYLKNPGKRNDG